ncbi:hypothetical protein GmHk_14G042044 [Glycine max]|nr:hypothetical protein GmHk_14G042044 [Glycine max]
MKKHDEGKHSENEEGIGNDPSLTSIIDSAKIEYISEGVIYHIIHVSNPKVLGMNKCIGNNPNLTLVRDSAKIKYISGRQPSSYELPFGVELDTNSHSKKGVDLSE